EYWAAIGEAAAKNISGGTMYDALLAKCALKAGAEIIYTWNVGDFERLGKQVARRLQTPYQRTSSNSKDQEGMLHSSTFLSRSEFVITDTELKLIAAAAKIGRSKSPKNG